MKTRSILLLLLVGCIAHADTTLPLKNASFEEGLEGWTPSAAAEEIFQVLPEAALLGGKGLRVEAREATPFSILSTPLDVTPGKTYTVSFWSGGNTEKSAGALDVKMVFKGPSGEELPPAMAKIRKWPVYSVQGGKFVGNPMLAAAAPEGAATLTLRIFSAKKTPVGPLAIDDFQVVELGEEAPAPVQKGQAHPIPASDPARLKALEEEIAANPYRGKKPPKIVLKLDDFVPVKGNVHPKWIKVADFAEARKIKVTFGIIGKKLTEECGEFAKWTKARHDDGKIEFWHHGWNHGERKDNGKRVMEFNGEPYEFQKQHMTDTNTLAREKLGFAFVSFGAPFNATDETTSKVLSEDPDIKVWMYGDEKNPGGKKVLERSYSVSIESPTLIPNYGAFLEGYAHNRGAEYFVLQGHPTGWSDERWDQFVKIVDFLIAQKAEFVFASDFAATPPAK
jgi:peptidoglycan/xylan/chitin deacetylase (PgdA/CDA1 family)